MGAGGVAQAAHRAGHLDHHQCRYDHAKLAGADQAQRRDEGRELEALMMYHTALEAAGVTGYSWQQLCDDYALMLRLMIFDPVHDAVTGASESY